MKTYELVGVAGSCRRMYETLSKKGSTTAYLFLVLKGRVMSFDRLFAFLTKLDVKRTPSLSRKIASLLREPTEKTARFGSVEMLLLLARLQNAAWRLPRMQGEAKVSIDCENAGEAMIWALTRFWTMTATDALMSIASDYLHGGDSFAN